MFARFPGIGPRQAKRFVYYVQSRSAASVKELTELIKEVRGATSECSSCHRFFIDRADKNNALCKICANPDRDHTMLMVVARDADFETIEKSGAFKGIYFILGGMVPILDKEPEKRIRLTTLLDRVKKNGIKEIILSLNATPEGENTAEVVSKALLHAKADLKLTTLGRGLSTGAELEYVDSDTIKSALENRH
jgi:recombination protein RecR